jgi:copper resistance protein C
MNEPELRERAGTPGTNPCERSVGRARNASRSDAGGSTGVSASCVFFESTMKTIAWLAIIALVSAATDASAQAFLDHAEPGTGSAVDTPPTEIKIWFTKNLEPDFSQIQLFDRHAKQVTGNLATVDADDPSLLRLSVPALAPGKYQVRWRAVSVDTRMTVGGFLFTVRKVRRR